MSPALLDAVRAGDPESLAALYREHGRTLYRLAYRLTGTQEDAEDVVHDVFVGLPEALAHYEERGKFTSWLKRVTARVALIRLRGERWPSCSASALPRRACARPAPSPASARY